MADADKKLSILIETIAKLQGLESTQQAMEALHETSGKLNDESKRYEQTLKSMAGAQAGNLQAEANYEAALQKEFESYNELSPKTKDYINSLRKMGDETVSLSAKKKALHILMRSLGGEFAAFGAIGRGLMNPWLLAAAGFGFVIKKTVEDANALREALASRPDTDGLQSAVASMVETLSAADWGAFKSGLDSYIESLDRLIEKKESLADADQKEILGINKDFDRLKREQDGRKKIELSQLEADKKSEKVTPAAAAQGRIGIENRYNRSEDVLRAQRDRKIDEAKDRQAKAADAAADSARAEMTATGHQALAAKKAATAADKELEQQQQLIADQNKWINENRLIVPANVLAEQQQKRLDAMKRVAELEESEIPSLKTQAETAQAIAQEARETYGATVKHGAALKREVASRGELEKQRGDEAFQRSLDRKATGIDLRSGAAAEGSLAPESLIQQAIEIASRSQGTFGLKKPEKELMQTVGSQVAGRSLSDSEADTMFSQAKGNNARIDGFIKRLLDVVETMPGKVLTAYESRLQGIEREIKHINSRALVPRDF